MIFDSYSTVARVFPALIAALPLALPAATALHSRDIGIKGVAATVVWLSVATVLAQVVRSRGKDAEKRLFAAWGGAPTRRRLRYDGGSAHADVALLHAALGRLLPEMPFPTFEAERLDSASADRVYDAAVTALRNKTRDRRAFPIVFAENRDYGFRRNAYGIRSVGVICAIAGLMAQVGAMMFGHAALISVEGFLPTLTSIAALAFWTSVCTEHWVREAAENYASQLLNTLHDPTAFSKPS